MDAEKCYKIDLLLENFEADINHEKKKYPITEREQIVIDAFIELCNILKGE